MKPTKKLETKKPETKKLETKKLETKKPEPEKPAVEEKPAEKQDESITCKVCTKVFVFSVRDQEFYKSRGYQTKPQRCRECARARKASTPATPVLVVQTPHVVAVENPRYLFQPRTPDSSPPRRRFEPKSPPKRFEPKSPPTPQKKKVFIVEEDEE
jgi:hypothetical protein